MSTVAIGPIQRAARFYDAPIGKKAIMAVTGALLFGYVIAHLIGNLQIFSPDREQINHYAAFLHNPSNLIPLWIARLVLLAAVGMHIVASTQLWSLNRAARPAGYRKKADVPSSYAARTMKWSGPIVGAFVIYHVLHLTVGTMLPLHEIGDNPATPDVRYNVISGFQNAGISAFYIFAMILLCMHLYHGLWSMFQSLGIAHPRHTPRLKSAAAAVAILIAIGNISIPLAVLAGFLTN
jgi:succinate dehydrogenase / fumarate reductase, cytochrome b subunit